MILQAFIYVGSSLTIADAYSRLLALYSSAKYPKKKAAGSLGGAVNGGTITLCNGVYTRIR